MPPWRVVGAVSGEAEEAAWARAEGAAPGRGKEAHGAGGGTEDMETVPDTGLGARETDARAEAAFLPEGRSLSWGKQEGIQCEAHPGLTGRVPEGDPRADGACAVPPQRTSPFFFRASFVLVIFVLGIRNLFVNQTFQLSWGSAS